MNIFEKMSAITEKINKVAKNLNVGIGKSAYKAVGEADVLSAVKPIEREFGVYSYPVNRKILESQVITSATTSNDTITEKKTIFMRIETTYRFVNIEKPEEFIDIITYGDGVDTQDKAPGKAMTYADKYALLKAYKIETGEDPDQKMSDQIVNVYKKEKVDIESISILKTVYTGANLEKLLKLNNVSKIEDLPKTKVDELIKKLYSNENLKNENKEIY